MKSLEIVYQIEDVTPVRITAAKKHPTTQEIKALGLSYWALSADSDAGYPPVLMHIYCTGPLPSDERRDRLNAVAVAYTRELLTGQRDSQHIEKPNNE